MSRLVEHGRERRAPPDGQLLRYRSGSGRSGDPAVLAGNGLVQQPDIAAAMASFSLVEHGGGLARRDRITACGSPVPRGFTGYEHCDRTICSHVGAAAAGRRVYAMTLPEGLIYVPGFLTEAEERDVLAAFELHPYVLHHIPAVTQERWSMTFRTPRHAAVGTR
jgi:hypothetical protein